MPICLSKDVHEVYKFNELKELENNFYSSKFDTFTSEYFYEDVLNGYEVDSFNSFFENDFSVYLLKIESYEKYSLSLLLNDSLENINDYYIIQTDDNNGFVTGYFITLEESKKVFEDLQKQYELGEIQDNINSFIPHGVYTVSNNTSYLIELSKDCDSARIKIDYNEVSEWYEIEYINDYNCNCYNNDARYDTCDCEMIPVIDPKGYMIPLNQVMRLN